MKYKSCTPVIRSISEETNTQRLSPPVIGTFNVANNRPSRLSARTSIVTPPLCVVPTRAVMWEAPLFAEIHVPHFNISPVLHGIDKHTDFLVLGCFHPFGKSDGFRLRLAERIQRLKPFSIPAVIFSGTIEPSLLNSACSTHTERVKPPPPGKAPL